jgi:hypothetical protein
MQVIIFKHEGQSKALYPTPEAVSTLGINTIAAKDVPAGAPFKIIDVSELPPRGNDEERSAWDFDEATLTDGIGANFGVGTPDVPIGYYVNEGIVVTQNQETGEAKAFDLAEQAFIDLTKDQ